MSKADLAALIALCAASATARGTRRLTARVSTVSWIESQFALFRRRVGR
jgi:hypothetical protein